MRGLARKAPRRARDTPKPPTRTKHAHPKHQSPKQPDAKGQGPPRTRFPVQGGGSYTTNDLPGCPNGGLLLGTDKPDKLYGEDGDDEIRGLGGSDYLEGGSGDDVLYGGDGGDKALIPNKGKDVVYGGDGNDTLQAEGGQRDKLYCGKGKDIYFAGKPDYVDSSCENKTVGAGA